MPVVDLTPATIALVGGGAGGAIVGTQPVLTDDDDATYGQAHVVKGSGQVRWVYADIPAMPTLTGINSIAVTVRVRTTNASGATTNGWTLGFQTPAYDFIGDFYDDHNVSGNSTSGPGVVEEFTFTGADFLTGVGTSDGSALPALVTALQTGCKLVFIRLSGPGGDPGGAAYSADMTELSMTLDYEGTNNALCGEKVIKYEVTTDLNAPYVVSPRGPDDDTHHSAFKISEDSRTVSAMVSLASEIGQDYYVQPMARFLSWDGLGFTVVGVVDLGDEVHLLGDGEWETITRFAAADSSATHWYLDLAVSQDAANLVAPDIGTVLYLDCTYIPENGLDLATEPYLDGDVVASAYGDGCWEGAPHNSTSIWCPEGVSDPEPEPPADDESEDGGEEETPVPDDDTGVTPPEVEPEPEPIVLTPEDQAQIILSGIDPAGLCLSADIQIGEHFFNTIDEFGVLWLVSQIEGWWTLPEPDIPDFPKGIDDGSYETRGRYTARVFTVTGSFIPMQKSDVRQARDRLVRAINLCHYGAWFATHESDATKGSKVWLSGAPTIDTINVNGRTDFVVGLKAPDPIKYEIPFDDLTKYNAVTMTSKSELSDFGREYPRMYPWSYQSGSAGDMGDQATAINIGNVRVYPVIKVTGATMGPIRIYNETTDQMMRVQLGITDTNSVLTIDCYNRTVARGTITDPGVIRNQRFYLDTFTDWIYLDPGLNNIYFVEETGVALASVTVEWRSGWIG